MCVLLFCSSHSFLHPAPEEKPPLNSNCCPWFYSHICPPWSGQLQNDIKRFSAYCCWMVAFVFPAPRLSLLVFLPFSREKLHFTWVPHFRCLATTSYGYLGYLPASRTSIKLEEKCEQNGPSDDGCYTKQTSLSGPCPPFWLANIWVEYGSCFIVFVIIFPTFMEYTISINFICAVYDCIHLGRGIKSKPSLGFLVLLI